MGQSGALTAANFGFQRTSYPHSPQGSQGTTSLWSEHVEEPFKPGNGDLTQQALYDFITTGADPWVLSCNWYSNLGDNDISSRLKHDDFWFESAEACQVEEMDLLDNVDEHSAVLAVSVFLGESPETVRSVVKSCKLLPEIRDWIVSGLDLYNEHSNSRAREYFDSKMAKELNVPTEPWMSMMRKLLEGPDETWTAETYKARDETILSAAQACGSMLGNDIRVHKAIHTVLNSECSPIIKSYMGDWAYHRVRHSDSEYMVLIVLAEQGSGRLAQTDKSKNGSDLACVLRQWKRR
jgi:hypothetical protein